MRDGNTEVNMTHAFATNNRASDFNSTLLTDNSLVANTAILLTRTFVVFHWTKDSFVEKTVLFWALGTVVNSLWLRNFTL